MNTLEHPSRKLVNVRAAIYGQPWAITDGGMKLICGIVEAHISGGSQPQFENALKYNPQSSDVEDQPGWELTDNDVAIVPISGPILPKSNFLTQFSGATALSELKKSILDAAVISPTSMILNIDSPGGSCEGLADFCSWLFNFIQASKFPVIGIANPMAASAAFMILSQCNAAYSTSGGIVGSIGTICAMDNWDRAERNAGNDPIVMRSSELKGVGYGPMSPNQEQELQRMMLMHDAKFQEAVSRGRPRVDLAKVSTGQVWHGQSANDEPSAEDMGLVDDISTLEQLIAENGN